MDEEEYVEFRVTDPKRFSLLQTAFNKIKADKDLDAVGDEKDYLPLFDKDAKAYFRWSTERENEEWLKRWYATPLETRWTDPSLKRGWSFDAMIAAFRDGEYELSECKMIGPTTARLTFHSYSYPYGGMGSMQTLVEAFGFKVIALKDDSGPAQNL